MQWYRNAIRAAINKEVDWDSDTLKFTLHTATYTPDLSVHDFVDDLTNELATSGGYTSGGLTLTSPTRVFTAANSWGVARANSTAYAVEDIIRPAAANGFLYRVTTAGTSGGAPPTFPTVLGNTVADGTATLEMVGSGIIVLDAADPSWAAATFGPCRYMVLSDRQTGVASTSPLLGLTDFGVNKTGTGAAFTVGLHASLGALHILVP